MRLRRVKNANKIIDDSPYIIENPKGYCGQFNKQIFKNDNPVEIEIGMGKGNFIIAKALQNPDINFIGIERYPSIIVRAIEKLEKLPPIPNLRLIVADAIEINNIFNKEITILYLNFSDPWPKKRHQKRRLTSPVFLDLYDDIFKNDKTIIQKTDNPKLFESSIVNLSTHGYQIIDISLDLENTEIDNCKTEYEEKFTKQGIKINYLKAVKK